MDSSVAPIGRISVKFGIGDFYEYLSRKSKFGYNWAKHEALHMKTEVCFIVISNIKST
jgi:hypothetical protein